MKIVSMAAFTWYALLLFVEDDIDCDNEIVDDDSVVVLDVVVVVVPVVVVVAIVDDDDDNDDSLSEELVAILDPVICTPPVPVTATAAVDATVASYTRIEIHSNYYSLN